MKKVVLFVLMIISMFGILSGCTKTDEVKDDLYKFLEEDIKTVNVQQKKAVDEYNSFFTAGSEVDSQSLLTALNDSIIPTYTSFLNDLKAITPATEEVTALKDLYVESAQLQLDAMNKVAEAIEACDSEMLEESDALLDQADAKFNEYQQQVIALAGEHDIVVTSLDSAGEISTEGDSVSVEEGSTDAVSEETVSE